MWVRCDSKCCAAIDPCVALHSCALSAARASHPMYVLVILTVTHAGHVNYNTVPNIIYTHPEVAAVGITEQEAKDAGHEVACGKFSFSANSRARCAALYDCR